MGWKPDHRRIKPKYNPAPNAAEMRHKARVKQMRCMGCGKWPVDAHHVMGNVEGKRWRRDHRFLVPLCHDDCHQGPNGVHGIGKEEDFCGKDLLAEARRLEAESVALGILPERREAA